MAILATTGSNGLRHAGTGLGVVRYWTYNKHAYGEAWEGNFPNTIYLVGCSPPWSVNLYCSDDPADKVYYRRSICLTAAPVSDYIYSWDRKTLCPWTDNTFCGGIEDPPDPDNIVDGEASEVDICIAYGHDGSDLIGPFMKFLGGIYSAWQFRGFVERDWYEHHSLGCIQKDYSDQWVFGPWSDGKMTKHSETYYSHGPVDLTLNIEEGTARVDFAANFSFFGIVGISGTYQPCYIVYDFPSADIAFDPESGGVASFEVEALYARELYSAFYDYCDEGEDQCEGHTVSCDAGSIGLTFTITETGTC